MKKLDTEILNKLVGIKWLQDGRSPEGTDCVGLMELYFKEKGVEDSIIESSLAKKSEEYSDYEIAFSMAGERFERLKKLDRKKALKRLYDFMLRRGFKYETVRKVVEKIVAANG